MLQKTTLTLLLIIGLISALFVVSCKETVDEASYAHYKYVNNTPKNININAYREGRLQTYNLTSGETLIVTVDLFIGPKMNDIVLVQSDSVNLIYDNSIIKSWLIETQSIRNPLKIANYENIVLSSTEQDFKFTFLENDFD
jgi:hypothetical protein